MCTVITAKHSVDLLIFELYAGLLCAQFLPMLRMTLITCKEEVASVMELVVIVL